VAKIRKAGAGNQPDISRADHGNPHNVDFPFVEFVQFATSSNLTASKAVVAGFIG
jgi:hypothetical protein